MTRNSSFFALALSALALTANAPAALAQATSAAQSACMSAVNDHYGGRVNDLRVVHSEFSQANSEVIVEADGARWRCLSSNDGQVAELSQQSGGGHSAPGGASGSGQGGVTLYSDYGFRGASETVYGNIADMKGTRVGNDSLSSVRVSPGCNVTLYTDNNYRGRHVDLYEDEPELGRTAVGNDTVSSVSVGCN